MFQRNLRTKFYFLYICSPFILIQLIIHAAKYRSKASIISFDFNQKHLNLDDTTLKFSSVESIKLTHNDEGFINITYMKLLDVRYHLVRIIWLKILMQL